MGSLARSFADSNGRGARIRDFELLSITNMTISALMLYVNRRRFQRSGGSLAGWGWGMRDGDPGCGIRDPGSGIGDPD